MRTDGVTNEATSDGRPTPTRAMISLRTAVAMVGAAVGIFFVGVYAAHAWPGRPGEARSFFTVAGTVTLPPASARPPTMRFVFHKTGFTDCSVNTVAEMPPTGDQFVAQIDYDTCGRGWFDGSDITVDVLVNESMVVPRQPINPVPYAQFATNAGRANVATNATSADRLAGGPRFIWDRLDSTFQWNRPDGGVAVDIPVPGLSLRLPSAGTYLLIFNARFFGTGFGNVGRDDLSTVSLVVRGRSIARQSLPGYLREVDRQRTGSVTIIAPYEAAAGDEVTVQVLAAVDVRNLEFAASSSGDDSARLIAIPMVEGL